MSAKHGDGDVANVTCYNVVIFTKFPSWGAILFYKEALALNGR